MPRFEIRHTSEAHSGQIYIPRINRMLLIAVMLLVLMFKSSSALASAYGISVTGTMVVTAMMGFVVIWKVWRWSALWAAALIVPFLCLDLTFLAANLLKVWEGGWVPLALGGWVMLLMYTWRRGSRLLWENRASWNSRLPISWRCWRSGRRRECRDGRVPDQRSHQRADRADAQPEALQGAA